MLIDRDDDGATTTLTFLTSVNVVANTTTAPSAISVALDPSHALTITRDNLFLTVGDTTDLALLRAETVSTICQGLVPARLRFEAPSPGDEFVVRGFDRNGTLEEIPERVRFASTLLAVGDREASALVGCLGAPVIAHGGVFGVTRACDAGRCPIVSLLSVARPFIERHTPHLRAHPSRAAGRADGRLSLLTRSWSGST